MKLNCLAMGRGVSRMRAGLALALLMTAGTAILCLRSTPEWVSDGSTPQAPGLVFGRAGQSPEQLRTVSIQLPLIFEPNQGQTDSQARFLSRGLGYGLFLTADAAVLELQHSTARNQGPTTKSSVIRMQLAGAAPKPEIRGIEPLPGKSNYFIGNDPAKWRRNVPQFARVQYRNVYPGIDLLYYGTQGQLEYDFVVAPGADSRQVVLSFDGPDVVKLQASGDILLQSRGDSMRLQAPRIYQKSDQGEQPVSGSFVMLSRKRVGFRVGPYDRRRELIIDPVLSYSTYLGGTGSEGCFAILGKVVAGCPAITADPGGTALYVTGTTNSADFPPQPGVKGSLKGPANVFVTKINPNITTAASQVVFSTYLGGTGIDYPVGIAVDSGFNVYVAGTTTSPDFPTGPITPFQAKPKAAGSHVFVSQLRSDGAQLLYSTYLSGSGTDIATGMAIDNKSDAFVTGTTTSSDFPLSTTVIPFQSKFAPGATSQFFASKVSTLSSNSGISGLLYSTFFGGSNPPTGAVQGGGIAVDSNGNFYITGTTNFLVTGNPSTDFPVVNAFQACLDTPPPSPPPTTPQACTGTPTATDAFVAKFNPTVTGAGSRVYATYVGGSGDDSGTGIAVDSGFNAYITGATTSSDFTIPTSTRPYQLCLDNPTVTTTPCPSPAAPVPTDAFIAKIGGAQISTTNTVYPLNYFSYLGGGNPNPGGGSDVGLGIAVDSIQNVRVTGYTNSTDFPLTTTPPPDPKPTAIQGALGGAVNAFVAHIDTTTITSSTGVGEWGTYLGGNGTDHGTTVALDVNGATYVAGDTSSTNFPVVDPFQTLSSGTHAFASKIGAVSQLMIPPFFPVTPGTAANPAVSPSPVGAGNQVTFTYTIINNGPDPATNVIVTDVLAAGATFGSATASPGSCIPAPVNGVETCAMGTLPVTPTGATSANTVKINVTPTAPGSLGDTISVTENGSATPVTASGTVVVTDFQISAAPSSATVTAGQPASYTVTVTPLPTYSGQVSLSCSAGLPSQATCAFSTTPVSFTNNGAVLSTLTINTVARPVTTATRQTDMPARYGTWLPMSGLALLGLGIAGKSTRRRRFFAGVLFVALVALLALQPACSSSKAPTTPPTGTPAGTYAVTVTGSSGLASHTTTLNLVVQ